MQMQWVMYIFMTFSPADSEKAVTKQFKLKGFESVEQCTSVKKDVAKMIRLQDDDSKPKMILICLPDPSTTKKKGTST